jgi:thioredoxin 2
MCGRCKTTLDLSGAPQEVDGTKLAQALDCCPIPVLVDFWAPWYQPCCASVSIVDEVARAHAGIVITLMLNTEQEPASAVVHGIQSPLNANGPHGVPTFILFRAGQEVARRSGVVASCQLSQWLDSARQRSAISAA